MKNQSLIENLEEQIPEEKASFEAVSNFFDALLFAFHPEGIDEEAGLDPKMEALWTLFLVSVGWTADEYWEHHDTQCPECGAEANLEDSKDKSEKPN